MSKSDTEIIHPLGNKRVKAKLVAISEFVENNKNKKFYVCCHDNPDPDAISSAMGMTRVVQFLGAEDIDIVYCGEISHPQNRAMSNVLTMPVHTGLKRWEKIEPVAEAIYIFVDCTSPQQKNMSIPHEPQIVIDHHKTIAEKGIISIHDEIGSCATLVTDLMLSLPSRADDEMTSVCFDPTLDGMKDIATALAVGIKTDTLDFRNETTTDFDFQAYKVLTKFMSDDKFTKIINYELPAYMFDFEEIAWRNRVHESPNFITGLKYVEPTKSDCIPYLADKYMRLPGTQTVLVYGIVGNAIRASVRTTSAALDCADLCSDIFGEGNGGAKHGIGGATVNFSIFDAEDLDEQEQERFWDLTKAQIEKKFKRATQK